MTPNEVISIAANNIGDGGFVNLTRDEYTGFLNDVAQDIWFRSKALHVVRDVALPQGAHYLDLPWTDIISFVDVYVFEDPTQQAGLGTTEPPGYDSSITPVWQKEKSIRKNVEEGHGWYMDIGDIVTRSHLTWELRGDRYRVHAIETFSQNQYLRCHCIIHGARYAWQLIATQGVDQLGNNPSDADLVAAQLESQIIWEPFRNAFIEGLTWRAARRHNRVVQSNQLARTESTSMDLYYSRYLPDVIHYIHSMRDASSTMQVRPFRYLEE